MQKEWCLECCWDNVMGIHMRRSISAWCLYQSPILHRLDKSSRENVFISTYCRETRSFKRSIFLRMNKNIAKFAELDLIKLILLLTI
jgi:hypothetical protein